MQIFFDIIILIVMDAIIFSIKQALRGANWISKSISNKLNKL